MLQKGTCSSPIRPEEIPTCQAGSADTAIRRVAFGGQQFAEFLRAIVLKMRSGGFKRALTKGLQCPRMSSRSWTTGSACLELSGTTVVL